MKAIFLIVLVMFTLGAFAQSPPEAALLKLSGKVFSWEIENKIDSLDNLFDTRFIAHTSGGQNQTKQQYIAGLKSGNVVHNSVEIEESSASMVNNTATVAGKGKFRVTVNGNHRIIHLSYLEVFIRTDERSPWKLLALHAGLLPN